MNHATVGFATFVILSLAAAVLLVRQVIRGVRGGHSTSSGFSEGGYFFAESGDHGERAVENGWGAGTDRVGEM